MATKSKSKQEEALQFLDDLDSFAVPEGASQGSAPPQPRASPSPPGKNNEAEVFAFIDEITQKSTEPTRTAAHIPRSGTPTLRKSTERVKLGGGPVTASSSTSSLHKTLSNDGAKTKEKEAVNQSPPQPSSSGGGWGWESVWTTASSAIQQAKSVVDEQVKQLPKNEQVRNWSEGVLEYAKAKQLDKLGQDFKRVGLSTLTDILNVVAPPIAEHETIRVWLSHDMQGYDGIQNLVYRSLTRILEQVEGGDLVVKEGHKVRPREGSGNGRDLNAIEGYEAAYKLAQVEIENMIKENKDLPTKSSNLQNPAIYSNVYLRIQPFYSSFESPAASSKEQVTSTRSQKLQFLVYLQDPEHNLTHVEVTQAFSSHWLALWDEYEWVEDLIADGLRLGVEVIGQEYVVDRMGWTGKKEETNEKTEAAVENEKLADS